MKVRLGYVAIALGLPKVTSSSTITYSFYRKLTTEQKINKLKEVTFSNISDLKKILNYNIANHIHFYRLTSALIPLATHPEVSWDYKTYFALEFKLLGEILRGNTMRVDTHPDQFNVVNSLDEQVVENTKRNLKHHLSLFDLMSYSLGKMVIHVGSAAGGKEAASKRFLCNFLKFPEEITSKLMLENDDKTFTAKETLRLCQQLDIPMVLDVHHHQCNNEGESINKLLPDIFSTWKGGFFPPKIHFSSPKDKPQDRKHADFIDANAFVDFIEICKPFAQDIDIMLEAKMKDIALFRLVKAVKALRKDWKWIDSTTFEV